MRNLIHNPRYVYLWSSRNMLAHLLCLLLVFSTPVLAQGSCGTMAVTSERYANCADFQSSPNGWNLRNDGYEDWQVSFFETNCRPELPRESEFLDPMLAFKAFSGGAGPGEDRRGMYELGVSPATLAPEGLDLNIFPALSISEELALKPSLSYSEDHLISRGGQLSYAPPKRWQNHYGELVLLVGRTDGNVNPVGAPAPNAQDAYAERQPVASELELFFINASGQQVAFYPDPSQFQTDDLNVPDGPIRFWFSQGGNYRLEDENYSANLDAFSWKLKTPDGLTYTFERYLSNFDDSAQRAIDSAKEWVNLRFRVKEIEDRYGNTLEITYRAAKSLQPASIKAPGFLDHNNQPMKIQYQYQAVQIDGQTHHRLSAISFPGYGGASQTYTFYYADSTADTGTQRHQLNAVGGQALQLQGTKATLNPFINTLPVFLTSGSLFFDVDNLGFVPRSALDFERFNNPPNNSPYQSFISEGYWFEILGHAATPLEGDDKNMQRRTEWMATPPGFLYRHQINSYPHAMESTYPDQISIANPSIASGENLAAVLPMVKRGDAVVWDNGTSLQTTEITDEAVVSRQVGLATDVGSSPLSGYHIRKDNRLRIAEIEYPSAANSSTKRMVITYDDHSLNHQEIASVKIFDEVDSNPPVLLSESQYTYERILVSSAAEENTSIRPNALPIGNYTYWEPCKKSGRQLSFPSHPVEVGFTHGGRYQEMDILRQKKVRYRTFPTESGQTAFQEQVTRYGGAYTFGLLGQSLLDENNPTINGDDPERTCDRMEWVLSGKPFRFTWQINPDGSATVFDLSPHGLGLDPALAFANWRRQIFKTYQFDTQFKAEMETHFGPFMTDVNGDLPYTPFFHFLPTYTVDTALCPTATCASENFTVADLSDYPEMPSNYQVPSMANLFALNSTCHKADITQFELVPLWQYTVATDSQHPNDFLRRLNIKTLHGSIQFRDVPTQKPGTYYRFSAIKAVANMVGQCTYDPIEKFFKGTLTTTATVQKDGVSTTITVPWNYGGRSDLGNAFQFFHDRQQTHRLMPHAQMTFQRLAGFAWDSDRDLLDIDRQPDGASKWLVNLSRYSNGGYMGAGQIAEITLTSGSSSWVTLQNEPADFRPGDFILIKNRYHLYQSDFQGHVILEPGIFGTIDPNEKVHFYRFAGDASLVFRKYVGYDVFGNQGMEAVYKKDTLFWPQDASTADEANHDLIPKFFEPLANPFSLTLNDANLVENNDSGTPSSPGKWSFFGRVSKTYSGVDLPFYDYANGTPSASTGSWNLGILETSGFENTANAYRWLPFGASKYFQKVSLGQTHIKDLRPFDLKSSSTGPHPEDITTQYRYWGKTGDTDRIFQTTVQNHYGKLALTRKLKVTGTATYQFTAARMDYDSRGRISAQHSATFKTTSGQLGATPYVTSSLFTRDANSGLQTTETQRTYLGSWDGTWNSGVETPATIFKLDDSGRTQGKKLFEYDDLGRLTRTSAQNAVLDPLGPITETVYHSATKQTSRNLFPTGTNPVMSEVHAYKNGLGMDLGVYRVRGNDPDHAYVSGTTYDAFGRVEIAGVEREVLSQLHPPDTWSGVPDLKAAGHTRMHYNLRGEPFGEVRYLNNNNVEGSKWTYLSQDEAGNQRTHLLTQVEDADVATTSGVSQLNVKRMQQDARGLLVEVADFQLPESSAIWQSQTDVGLKGKVTTLTNPLAKATYHYDRFGNVIQADIGNGTTPSQVRTFRYDQFSRLRFESHPEMTDGEEVTTVAYDAFDHFNNPLEITYLDSNGAVQRKWQYTYHTSGELAEVKDKNGVLLSDYVYLFNAYMGSSAPTATFPGNLRFARHHQDGVAAYVHDYDPDTGLLADRSFYHNWPQFPGYAPQIGTVNLTQGAGNQPTLPALGPEIAEVKASYTYNALGLTETLTYPAALTGMPTPTALRFLYDETGLIKTIRDEAFTPHLDIVRDVIYGINDQPTLTQWSRPGGSGKNNIHKVQDKLGRLSTWKAIWSSNQSEVEERAYKFDSQGRIKKIEAGPSRSFSYAYDGLGQLRQAKIIDPLLGTSSAPGTYLYTYTYDSTGLGNLMSLTLNNTVPFSSAVNLATNQLVADQAAYNLFGEQTRLEQNGQLYGMDYNDMGRMKSYTHLDPSPQLTANYSFDHAGMRVYNETLDTRSGGSQTRRLYFYDAGNMVLAEWVSEKEGTTWKPPHWDTSHLYFDGKSSMTFEYDAVTSQSPAPVLPQGPSMTHAVLLEIPLFTWDGDPQQTYDLEIQDEFAVIKGFYRNLNGTAYQAPKFLKAGKYRVRVRLQDQVWGPWHETYYLPPSVQDLAGDFGFDNQGLDTSFYKSHLDATQLQFAEGKSREALHINLNQEVIFPKPHQFSSNVDGSLSFWVKFPPPNAFVPQSYDVLWQFGTLKLALNEGQVPCVRWAGSGYQTASSALIPGEWNHLTLTFGQGLVNIYLNAQPVFSTTNGPLSHPFAIGNYTLGNNKSTQTWEGDVDGVRFWNHALSASEIQTEFNRLNGTN